MSEMDFDARARAAAQRAETEVAMVDIPEADAVVGRRRARHRARIAVAGAVAVVVLGGGIAFAVVNAGGGSSKSEVAHEPTTTTTTAQQAETGPQLPANVLAWLKQYAANLPARNHADYADWVLTTRQKAMAATNGGGTSENQRVYLFDVHGEFVWNHSCPANGPECWSTGNDEIFTVDAATLQTLDFTVGNPVDLTKLGPVGRVMLGRAQLEFRVVENTAPYSANDCGPIGLTAALEGGSFHDNTKRYCYSLGPTILTGSGVVKAQATVGVDGAWQVDVTFGNDDFVNKVAKPYVNQEIAIVVDGVVYSAPKINAGITGRDVTISGDFTEKQATDLAAALSASPAPTEATSGREFSVDSGSMLPSLHIGDTVRAITAGFTIQRGDVGVFTSPVPPATLVIKRVVGLPGDSVLIRAGQVYIDGKPLVEPYVAAGVTTDCSMVASSSCPPVRLGAGTYYVLGDNRPNSKDSRFFGPVSGKNVIAVATGIVSPSDRAGHIPGSPRS